MSRKAGAVLRAVDNKYADAIVDMFMGKGGRSDNPVTGDLLSGPARYLGGTRLEQFSDAPIAASTSLASRYGAPLLGAAGAAAVVGGTTNAIFGGPEDGQQPGQLDLGALTVASLVGGGISEAGIAGTNLYRQEAGIAERMAPTARQRIGMAAAGAGASMLTNALAQQL